jgi:Protein of unknown function (DUF1488)
MLLSRGEILGYDFNRMVVDFTMLNQGKTVRCAISTAAMDDLEGKHDVKADQRIDQFVRLRDAIEHRESSSKGHARLKDRWCCDPTISSSSPERSVNRLVDRRTGRRGQRPGSGSTGDRLPNRPARRGCGMAFTYHAAHSGWHHRNLNAALPINGGSCLGPRPEDRYRPPGIHSSRHRCIR